MTRIALTGGLASGKSHCLAQFASLGAPIIDADVLAKASIAGGTPGWDAVVARFGRQLVLPNGEIDRKALAAQVFADPAARTDLENIVHPAVYRAIEDWFRDLDGPLGIADIPLLYETGRQGDFDRVIVSACRPEQQLARAIGRGISETDARQRIAAQWDLAEKARLADDVIDTSGSYEETDRQIRELWARINDR
jgi:dephospho-CoA kinase